MIAIRHTGEQSGSFVKHIPPIVTFDHQPRTGVVHLRRRHWLQGLGHRVLVDVIDHPVRGMTRGEFDLGAGCLIAIIRSRHGNFIEAELKQLRSDITGFMGQISHDDTDATCDIRRDLQPGKWNDTVAVRSDIERFARLIAEEVIRIEIPVDIQLPHNRHHAV